MSDDQNSAHPLDAKHIDLNDLYELHDWCKTLGCTKQELRSAVEVVGTSGSEIRKYLAK